MKGMRFGTEDDHRCGRVCGIRRQVPGHSARGGCPDFAHQRFSRRMPLVDDVALADRNLISLCMACGSRNIRTQGMAEGLWVAGGEGVAWTCEDCHHLGQPFLMDPELSSDEGVDDAWKTECADAAFAVDDDVWQARPSDRPLLGRGAAVVFVTLGSFFLVPPFIGIESALAAGSLYGAVRALVGMGWLVAIGSALLVVGLRRLRHRAVVSDTDTAEPERT